VNQLIAVWWKTRVSKSNLLTKNHEETILSE
jgi:hypothetical protein